MTEQIPHYAQADAEAELHQLERLRQAWMVGVGEGLALEQLPAAWRALVAAQPGNKQPLTALALATQQQLFLGQHRGQELRPRPPLPALDLATLPEALRPAFRRCLKSLGRNSHANIRNLLNLLLQRARVAHPADWLPGPKDLDLPEPYWPWARWAANELDLSDQQAALNAENWDDLYPAQRLALLRTLRLADPAAARELIRQCAPREPADKRLPIMAVLALNLGDEDEELLRGLVRDRSKKIARLAEQLLYRLDLKPSEGDAAKRQELASELAETLELKRAGLLKRQQLLVPKRLKNDKQRSLRNDWLQQVPPQDLARALGLELPALLQAWHFAAHRDTDNHAFLRNAADLLSDDQISLLFERLIEHIAETNAGLELMAVLLERLPLAQRGAVVHRCLADNKLTFTFQTAQRFVDQPLPQLSLDEIRASNAWKALEKGVGQACHEGGHVDDDELYQELLALGLLLSQQCAAQILERLTRAGAHPGDPAFDALRLNAKLPEPNRQEANP
jgi:hypothetical protein